MALFREEALESKKPKLYGEVHIPTNIKYASLSGLTLAFMALLVLLGLYGDYSKSETVVGHLVPTKGLVKIQAFKAGTLQALYVEQGVKVVKGDALFSVDTALIGSAGQSIQQIGLNTIVEQLALLAKKGGLGKRRLNSDLAVLWAEQEIFERSLSSVAERLALQRQLKTSTEKTFEDSEGLRKSGYISRVEFESRRQAFIVAQQHVRTIEHELVIARNKLDGIKLIHEQRVIEFDQKVGQLDTEILLLKQRRAEIEGERNFSLHAPVSGTITSVLTAVGKAVGPLEALVTILPEGGGLQAELFVPSRAIGFIEVGQEVKLAYDAFPYQQYGTFTATIVSITRTMLLPEEVDSGFPIEEPVYRVFAAVTLQEVAARGQKLSFRPGMRVDATIVLERLTLFGWLWQSAVGAGGRA